MWKLPLTNTSLTLPILKKKAVQTLKKLRKSLDNTHVSVPCPDASFPVNFLFFALHLLTCIHGTHPLQFSPAVTDESGEASIRDEGLERFLSNLNINAEGVDSLILAWQFGAQTLGEFSKEEFTRGMKKHGYCKTAFLSSSVLRLTMFCSNSAVAAQWRS